jgi:hypothetical protein
MDKLDQAYFKRHLERLKAEGVPAIWIGGERHSTGRSDDE